MLEKRLNKKIILTQQLIDNSSGDPEGKLVSVLKYRQELFQYLLDVKVNGVVRDKPTRTTETKPVLEQEVEVVVELVVEPVVEFVEMVVEESEVEPEVEESEVEPVVELVEMVVEPEVEYDDLTDLNEDDLKEQEDEENRIRDQLAQLELTKLLKKKPRKTKKILSSI